MEIKQNIIHHGKRVLLSIIFLLVILATLQVALSYGDYSPGYTDRTHESYYSSHNRVSENGRTYYRTKDPATTYQKNYKTYTPSKVYSSSTDSNTRHGYGTVVDTSAGRTIYSYNSYGYATATSGVDHMRTSEYSKNTYGTHSANYYRSTPSNSDYYYSTNVAYYGNNGDSKYVRTKYVNSAYGTTNAYRSSAYVDSAYGKGIARSGITGNYVSNAYGTGTARSGITGDYVRNAYGSGTARTSYSGNYVKVGSEGYGDPEEWNKPHYYARQAYQNTKYKTYSIPTGMDRDSSINSYDYYRKTYKHNIKSYDYDNI